ncbi:hypothetical protein [Nonomuraea angiospora]
MPTSGETHGNNAPADHLSKFVRDWLADHDESTRSLADKATDSKSGFTLQHGWIASLARARVPRAPELWRLRALSAGMGVPVRLLAELAAAQWLGLEVTEAPVSDASTVAVTVPEGLSPAGRERFTRMAEDLARHLTE